MQVSTVRTNNLIGFFFLFVAFFPTLRQVLIGSETAITTFQYLISALPDLMLIALFVFAFIQINRAKSISFHVLDKLIIGFVIYNVLVGTLIAGDLKASLYAIRMSYFPMALYFMVSFSELEIPKWDTVLEKICLMLVFIGVIGILLYFVFPKVQLYFLENTSDKKIQTYFIIRMTSVFWSPVVFGVCISAAVLYWIYRYILQPKWIFLVYLTVLFVCIFLAVSRGPMIALTLGTIALGIILGNYRRFIHVLALELAVFVLVGFYISNPIDFAYWIISSSAETVGLKAGVSRVELWRRSIESVIQHPFGLGLGKAGHTAARFYNESDKTASVSSTDGWFLKLMLETGFAGLLFYLSIGLVVARKAIQYIRNQEMDSVVFILVLFGVVNLLNLVSNVLDFHFFAYLFWLILGIFVLKLKKAKYV